MAENPRFYILLLTAFVLVSAAQSQNISIRNPHWLEKMYKGKGKLAGIGHSFILGLKTSVAMFGTVPYGHTILGRLEFADPIDACKDVKVITTKEESEIPFIVLAKRGNCTFATKAFNAG